MPIKFRCTCGKVYKVADDHAGRKIVCKGCGKKLKIPGAVEAAVAAGDSFEFSSELPDRSPKGAAPPPLVVGKRKRKPAADAPSAAAEISSSRKTLLIAGLVLFGLVGAGGIAFVALDAGGGGGRDAAPPAPQQYVAFSSEHGGFRCQYPEGWSAEQGGGTGGVPPWARFKDGTATIQIKASASGSAISDIAGAGQFPGGLDDQLDDDLTPIAQVHSFQRDKIALDYSDYEEKPGENVTIPWGEVRMSEFTASEGFGSKVQGFRVTLTGVQWQFNMLCTCPPRKWDQYRPIFDHVIRSVDR